MERRGPRLLGIGALAVSIAVCSNPSRPSPPDGPTRSIDGTYTVRLETTCGAVPVQDRIRTYFATIAGSPQATVTLSGATFWQHHTDGLRNTMQAFVEDDTISVSVTGQSGVTEQVSPTTYFYFRGNGSGPIVRDSVRQTVTEMSLTLAGSAGFGEHLLDPSRHNDCGGNVVTLKFTPVAGPAPPPAIAPSITRVDIAGPESVPPGQSTQLTITAHLTDGSTRDVTSEATWRSSQPWSLTVTSGGLATGIQLGESVVSVTVPRPNLNSVTRTRELLVLPSGTYRLSGIVTDVLGPVSGAKVEVTSGPATGQTTFTGGTGEYRLFGVAGETGLLVTRSSFEAALLTVHVSGHQTQNVEIRPSGTRRDVSGTYTLTISAAFHCRTLPDALKTRKYTAAVTQDGTVAEVTLSGARFVIGPGARGNRFRGRVGEDAVEFAISSYPQAAYGFYFPMPDHPEVVEDLSPGYLMYAGPLHVSINSTGLASGDLFGWILAVSDVNRHTIGDMECGSPYGPGHRFEFSR